MLQWDPEALESLRSAFARWGEFTPVRGELRPSSDLEQEDRTVLHLIAPLSSTVARMGPPTDHPESAEKRFLGRLA